MSFAEYLPSVSIRLPRLPSFEQVHDGLKKAGSLCFDVALLNGSFTLAAFATDSAVSTASSLVRTARSFGQAAPVIEAGVGPSLTEAAGSMLSRASGAVLATARANPVTAAIVCTSVIIAGGAMLALNIRSNDYEAATPEVQPQAAAA